MDFRWTGVALSVLMGAALFKLGVLTDLLTLVRTWLMEGKPATLNEACGAV